MPLFEINRGLSPVSYLISLALTLFRLYFKLAAKKHPRIFLAASLQNIKVPENLVLGLMEKYNSINITKASSTQVTFGIVFSAQDGSVIRYINTRHVLNPQVTEAEIFNAAISSCQ